MRRINRIGVYQTSKVIGIIYFVITALVFIPMGLISLFLGSDSIFNVFQLGGAFLFFAPVLYGIIAFISTAIACFVYNIFARWTGGIELDLGTAEEV